MRSDAHVVPFRPLVPVALAFAAGVVLGDAGALRPGLGLLGAVLLVGPIWAATRLRGEYRCLLCLPWFLLGLEVQSRAMFVDPRHDVGRLATTEGRLVMLRGEVVEHPIGSVAGGYEIQTTHVGLPWLRVRGRVTLFLPRGSGCGPGSGDQVELAGRLRPLTGSRNPGQFDMAKLLCRRGIRARLDVGAGGSESIRCIRTGAWWRPRRQIESVRAWLARWSSHRLRPEADGLFRALLLGDRTGLSPERLADFRRGGILHFLAISGLHVALAAMGLHALLRAVGLSRGGVAVVVILALGLQCGLAGFRTPVVRAAVLAGGALVAPALVRAADSWNLMAGAALLTLLVRPAELFAPGFALSYAAVAGILLFSRRFDRSSRVIDFPGDSRLIRLVKRLARAVLRSLAVTLAAWLGSGPLIWEWFGTFHPWVPLANLVVMPLFVGTLATALVVAVLAPFGPVAAVPAVLFSFLASTLMPVAHGVAALPGAAVAVPLAGVPALVASYGALLLVHRWRGIRAVAATLIAVGILLVGGTFGGTSASIPGGASVGRSILTVLDVGQGLCVFLRTAAGHVWLFDAGSTDRPDVTERIIRPFLRVHRVGRAHGAVLSHPDSDHQCGFPELVRQGFVDRILSPTAAGVPSAAVYERALEGWREQGIQWRLRAFHPAEEILEVLDSNDRSLVVLAEVAGLRVLLPGDVEEAGLAHLNRVLDGPVHVLVMPHHGGWADNLPEFLTRASPRLVLISARRGFTSSRTSRLLEARGIPFLTTWTQGAITLSWTADHLDVATHAGLGLSLKRESRE